ncbi:hypothetical protein E4T39_02180 [Aureobasidium subglaciale]|nr:hypothetical protein E4T39_02180 [Aureobasidium subglaciale]
MASLSQAYHEAASLQFTLQPPGSSMSRPSSKASAPPSPDGALYAPVANASSSAPPLPPSSTMRNRLSTKTTTPTPDGASPVEPLLSRRRSSLLSFSSLDDTRHSAGDFIRPTLGLDDDEISTLEDVSHWHSSPLAFAVLPAIAGLFFTNGSAFVTDIILLGLAALFLNWSVRLPWDWYRSAQAQSTLDQFDSPRSIPRDMDNDDDQPRQTPEQVQNSQEQEDAAANLRQHELLALISTFLVPACAAYLLHVIRGQLSRPSEGLVSDYNLTIFLLAAEIRPVRQLIRLFTQRTLHLQRIVRGNTDPSLTNKKDKAISELASRLVALEVKFGNHLSSPGVSMVQKEDVTALSGDIKKRYEPRLDALERAVRRYEKRATTLTLLTEQRLQYLENRLQDALSLAAVAAQSSSKPGVVAAILSTLAKTMAIPLEFAWFALVWPLKMTELVIKRAGVLVIGPSHPPHRRSDSKGPRVKSEKKKDDSYFSRHY